MESPRHNALRLAAVVIACLALAAAPVPAQEAPAKPEPAGAWMGVRVRPVPEALAAHLPLGQGTINADVGLMVVNLVKDGPADAGGLLQYDVITHFDGELVTGELGRFVRQIGAHPPGDKVILKIIRRGKATNVAVTLGASEPALSAAYTYKYPEQPSGVFQESADVRGAVITRSGGTWQMQDFKQADPAMFNDLPPEIRAKVMAWTGDVAPMRRTVVNGNGAAVEISRDSSGQITVRRSVRDDAGLARVVTQTYKDADALKAADEAAYALQQKIEKDPALATAGGAEGDVALAAPPPTEVTEGVDNPPTDPDERARALTNAEMYREQIRNYEAFLEQYTAYLRDRMDAADGDDADAPVPMMWKELLDRANAQQLQPQREFKVDPSGRIDVRIRKDAGDLVISFRNEEEMAAMYPNLYQQYRKLVAGDE